MKRGQGRPEITVALIDGTVVLRHPDLVGAAIREIPGKLKGVCTRVEAIACTHGTWVAGILCARQGSVAPAICPGCGLLVRPIFKDEDSTSEAMSYAAPKELAGAVIDSVNAGARVINLGSALAQPSSKAESKLETALNYAARICVILSPPECKQWLVARREISRNWHG
jgi:hypothetical protein